MAPRAATPLNKRKRAAADQGEARTSPPARNGAAAASTEAQFDDSGLRDIIAHNNESSSNPNNTTQAPSTSNADAPPTSAAETANAALSDSSLTQYQVPPSFDPQEQSNEASSNNFSGEGGPALGFNPIKDTNSALQTSPLTPSSNPKPPVGSDEWHRIRRDNHKEVERRRRETINEGITELSKIVPGCDKNKGSILQRAIQYIGQLKENEQQNIEKWTLEKLLLDQAITELSATAERLKNDSKFYQRERDAYKKACVDNDVALPEVKDGEAASDAKASTEA